MSYGANLTGCLSTCGTYAGRILRGELPSDLPILMPTKFELTVNLNTAKEMNFDVSDRILALADEVIE